MTEHLVQYYGSYPPDCPGIRGDSSIVEHFNLQGFEKILDIGSGGGFDCKEISKKSASVLGIDTLPSMVDYARKNNSSSNITYKTADVLQSYITENGFDGILMNWVAFQFDHGTKIQLFEQIYSALRPGGIFILSDTFTNDPKQDQGGLFFEHEESYFQMLSMFKIEFLGRKELDTMFYRFSFKLKK